jgi:hypothetical protein
LLGREGLPRHLVAQLQEVDFIVSLADQFAQKIVADGAV